MTAQGESDMAVMTARAVLTSAEAAAGGAAQSQQQEEDRARVLSMTGAPCVIQEKG